MTTFDGESDGVSRITALVIPENARLDTLPRHFGARFLRVQDTVFELMRRFATQYDGGFWEMLDLSNGGFYMRTGTEPVRFRVDDAHQRAITRVEFGNRIPNIIIAFIEYPYVATGHDNATRNVQPVGRSFNDAHQCATAHIELHD